jgi:hypothetical protein
VQREKEELFDHEPTPLTVRDLARALGVADNVKLAMPDETLVVCAPADEPGGDVLAEDQVLVVIDPAAKWLNYNDRTAEEVPVLYLGLEFPRGRYYRKVRS